MLFGLPLTFDDKASFIRRIQISKHTRTAVTPNINTNETAMVATVNNKYMNNFSVLVYKKIHFFIKTIWYLQLFSLNDNLKLKVLENVSQVCLQ